MQPITYRLSLRTNVKFVLFQQWSLIGLAVLALAVFALGIWHAERSGAGIDMRHFVYLLASLGLGLTGVLMRFGSLPARNFMALDDAGLRYVRTGVALRWPWCDLPAFSVTVHPYGARVVELRPPAARGLRSRLALWAVWLADGRFAAGHRVIRLSDIYDAPLDQITAKLNDYRARALADAPGQA